MYGTPCDTHGTLRNVLVGQSGGPTAAINASLVGVVSAARRQGAHAVGMRYGIEGFLAGRTVDLDAALPTSVELELLRHTPASWLGSCRYKLPDASEDASTYERLFSAFERQQVDAVLYIGGNDSMDTIAKLGAWGSRVGSGVRFVGIPKTIDNDLVGTDHTPGYGSAAKYVATSIGELSCDSDVYDLKGVTVVEIMGRDAGWLAAGAALATQGGVPAADVILLPEAPLEVDALLGRLEGLLAEKSSVILAASEGARTPDGRLVAERTNAPGTRRDAFGHLAALSGTSRYLAQLVRERLGVKARAVEISTLQRCASHCASVTDLDEAFALGAAGVEAAERGGSERMCALRRSGDAPYGCSIETVDVHAVANRTKPVPSSWIAADGMGLTVDFERYARPLIAGEPTLAWEDGLPQRLAPLG